MNFSNHVKTATTFQKLSHDDQLMLRLIAREGISRLSHDEFLQAAQQAIYSWLALWTDYTGPEPNIVAELLELQHQISNALGGDATNMHS